jgi:uncharacterized membrane protein
MRSRTFDQHSFGRLTSFIGGALAGSSLMYMLDPDKGTRRRAIGRDKIVSAITRSQRAGRSTAADLGNRAKGRWHELLSALSTDLVSPEVLEARIWAHVGGYVSHPRSVNIRADADGSVTITGQVLAGEADTLIDAVAAVPGVVRVASRLEERHGPGAIPSLQGGALRRSSMRTHDRQYWSPSRRLLVGTLGAALSTYGLAEGKLMGKFLTGTGGTLLLRSVSNMELARFFGFNTGDRLIDIHKTIEIRQPVSRVFAFWRDANSLSEVLEHVHRIEDLGKGRFRWRTAGPAGLPVSWEACLTRVVPDELIAWRTSPGSMIAGAGVVRFQPSGDSATRIDIQMSYNPPAGMLGHCAALLTGTDPKHAMDKDLVRLKSLLETGRTRAHGREITRPAARIEAATHHD